MKCDGGKAKHQPEREDRLAGSERAFSSRPVSTLQVRRLKHGPGLPKAFLKWDNAFIDCGLGTIEIPSIIAHITMRASQDLDASRTITTLTDVLECDSLG
jgi:hypothetical protein